MSIKSLSVFFPAYNEEANIKETVEKAVKVLTKFTFRWEVIIVDDGSIDKTGEIVEKIANVNKQVRVVTHSPNKGYGAALKSGFAAAKYEWVAFADSDGQFEFAEISKLIDKTDQADWVLGYRLDRADSVLRKIYTFGWSLVARILFGYFAKDYSCGFKLIKKSGYEQVLPLQGEEKVTQIEMLVKARRQGQKFAEVGVHHYPRKFGKQTGANIKVVLKSVLDLFKLWLVIK